MDKTIDGACTSAGSARSPQVQHVTKRSSDELLRKFAEMGDDPSEAKKELRLSKRQKRSGRTRRYHRHVIAHYSTSCMALVERRSLLLPAAVTSNKSVLLRQLGIGRSRHRLKNKSILATIGKTWHRTLEGASRILLDKHYNGHRRLINDMA